jgi:hypothetical protein
LSRVTQGSVELNFLFVTPKLASRAQKLDFDEFSAPLVEIFRSVTPNFAIVELSNWNLWSRVTPPIELIVEVQYST